MKKQRNIYFLLTTEQWLGVALLVVMVIGTLVMVKHFQPEKKVETSWTNDSTRAEFVFVDRYTSIPEYDNFVDLDACIQNIFCSFESEAFNDWRHEDHELSELISFRAAYTFGAAEEEHHD